MRAPITLRQLEIFVAVARGGHVTRAAEALHLTQSATSMALAQLERQLDTRLFERSAGRLKLTEGGRLLLAEAPDLLSRVAQLPAMLGGTADTLRGELHVAASTTVGRYLVAPALAAFARRHPQVAVHLLIGNTETAASALLDHRADIAYVEGAVEHPGLAIEVWRMDTLEIVGSAKAWKNRAQKLSRSDLAKQEWIMREPGSGTRAVLEGALRAAKLPSAKALLTLDDSEAILQVVASGIGLACLSSLVTADGLRSKRLIRLQAPYLGLQRTFWRMTRRGPRSGPVQMALDSALMAAG